MHLDLGLLSAAILLLTPTVLAVNINFHSQNYCYGSAFWSVKNVPSNTCYSSYEASSINFENLPDGAKAQGYVGNGRACNVYGGELTNSGCLYRSDSGSYYAGNWFYPYKRLAKSRRNNPEDDESLGLSRFTITYELPDQTTREVEIPEEEFQLAIGYLKEENFEALAKYPKVSPNHDYNYCCLFAA